ncbi:putative alpha/beta hydrolase [Paraphaeosphaeria minitans]|uniref:Alpha/beta hydrolase n=1 Tax=Paraphaeosphaeria minitans TaxID=565426 RepID=A0A9P6GLS7_9PLEO|nr:putative alpha/beta hydrolase [Paraphaeosphaeria minitans]
MAQSMKGPGILYVKACINPSPSNPLEEPQYMHWYDDDHIAEIVETSGMPSAFRYFHVNKTPGRGTPTPECPRPYLAFYPMPDIAFTQGPEFKKIRVHSDMLPGTGLCYDMTDNDVRYYALVGQKGNVQRGRLCEKGQLKVVVEKSTGSGKYLATSEIEPASDVTDEEVKAFLDQQVGTVSKLDHYQRSLRFKLLLARTNAQSRIMKGLAAATDDPAPEPPTWLQIHEFSAEPQSDVRATIEGDGHEVLKKARQKEAHGYRLERAHGQKKFFEDEYGTA